MASFILSSAAKAAPGILKAAGRQLSHHDSQSSQNNNYNNDNPMTQQQQPQQQYYQNQQYQPQQPLSYAPPPQFQPTDNSPSATQTNPAAAFWESQQSQQQVSPPISPDTTSQSQTQGNFDFATVVQSVTSQQQLNAAGNTTPLQVIEGSGINTSGNNGIGNGAGNDNSGCWSCFCCCYNLFCSN
ncbi:MAG: hypothetical protein M1827_003946 [Pycnora praestabilis]|nr:MAG: hypothetical protein M1827_003946 [Pycnora praestabilis]